MGVRFSLLTLFAWLYLLLIMAVLGIARPVSAANSPANPPSGAISPGSGAVTWSGGPFTSTTTDPLGADCTNSDCNNFLLTVTGTDATLHEVTIRIEWLSPTNDLDLHVLDNETGAVVIVGGEAASNFEQVTFTAPTGTRVYRVSTLIYRAVAESYTGTAEVRASGTTPEPPNQFRTANYSLFDFDFKPEVELPDQKRSLVFVDQDIEPEIEVDRFGTIYIGAIRGVPTGVDFWRSDDGGASFQYLGQPDGAQSPAPFPVPSPEGGAGGGDVDLALGDPFFVVPPTLGNPGIQSTGRIYCTSLWLGSATLSVSVDRGDNWVASPFTTAELDRQWNVARGPTKLYMSLRKLSNIVLGQHDVYVTQSDDGLTFTKSSYVMDPVTGVPDDVGGNSVLTSDGTLFGTFVSVDGKDLYLWRTPKGGTSPPADLPPGTGLPAIVPPDQVFDVAKIFHGVGNLTTNNTFPIMTVDRADNLHIAFTDRQNIYLISCPESADPINPKSWTLPVRLNAPGMAGFEFTRTCIFPWVRGGDDGKVAVIWYGSDHPGDPDTPAFETDRAPWKIIYAQVENALSATPDVFIDIASQQEPGGGGIVHRGQICVRGTGCPNRTRELAEYSSVTVDNQGFANIAYAGTIHKGVDTPSVGAISFFTKSMRRPLITNPPLARAECHDRRVSRKGGWHDIEDADATNGHYCRNVGAKKGKSGAYLQFQFHGEAVDLRIARGPRGGNASVLIDGISRGEIDFWRAPTDPEHPDNTGREDLTFGEFVSFPSPGSGTHTFRLEVLNDAPEPEGALRDMIYVDGFVITNGDLEGLGNPIESSIVQVGTVPAGTPTAPGVSTQTITASKATSLLTGVLEMTDGADLDLALLDPAGAVLATAATGSPTEVTRYDPGPAGLYTFVVKNKGAAAEYRLFMVRTEDGGGALAAAALHQEHAARSVTGAFDPSAPIVYRVASSGRVLIRVFTANGRLVRTLFDQVSGPGRHVTRWDGRTQEGTKLPSGVYLFRVQHPDGDLSTVKTVLLH